jgi:hypothetical protein
MSGVASVRHCAVVIAAPWSHVTHDYMALLKVVVLVARALAR